ncbi:hypothetical protein [uncultured Sulfitobacter sp.]|uniref:hypothetical protein n=1 Tax=uncultured Sulfitobacter sp. TaxID=191468 RepID=UPI00262FD547|nr:hypothetical protein [uncultured Sulfitobacter sp.]
MGEVSIWQWAVTDDLGALFTRLVAADADGFARIAAEGVSGKRLADMAAATEAKMREMGLPEAELATILKGLEAMLEEEEAWAEVAAAEGTPEVGLATSHMFFEDPHASIDHEEREAQVAELFGRYKAAAAQAIGLPGQGLAEALGVTLKQLYRAEDADALIDTGLDPRSWVWAGAGVVYTLNQWQEDNELPIDLTFARMPVEAFNAVRAAVQSA